MNNPDVLTPTTTPLTAAKFPIGKLIYSTYTLAHAATLVWAVSLFVRSPHLGLALVILVLAGLVYDNLIIAIGDRIGQGALLETLNKGRYWCHGLLSPLLLVFAVQMLHLAGVQWDQPTWGDRFTWVLVLCLIGIEVQTRILKLNLKPVTFAGTLRYKEVVPSKEIPVILVILLVGAIGAIVWQALHWSWLFWGAAVMLTGSAVPTTTKAGPSIGSAVEVLFGISLVATYALLILH